MGEKKPKSDAAEVKPVSSKVEGARPEKPTLKVVKAVKENASAPEKTRKKAPAKKAPAKKAKKAKAKKAKAKRKSP